MYTLYKLYNVRTVKTYWWKAVQPYCVHTVQLYCSPTWKQSPPGLGRSHRRTQERTIYHKPCNVVRGVLRPSVPSIHLGFPRLSPPPLGRGREATPPSGGNVALAEARATLPNIPWTLLPLWNDWPIRGHRVTANQTWQLGRYFLVLPAVEARDVAWSPARSNIVYKDTGVKTQEAVPFKF